jgi:hypothetical protein
MIIKEFHIHIDASFLEQSFEDFLRSSLQFSLKNFAGVHPDSQRHAPDHHLTYKTQISKDFQETFAEIESYLDNHPDCLTGYVEGEYIPGEISISHSKFDPEVAPPFQLERGSLPAGEFREDEIHITLDRDRSDPRLLLVLRQMGFFSVYMEKSYGTAEIFTTQGSYKNIQSILPLLIDYLNHAGGAANCVVKEERIVNPEH